MFLTQSLCPKYVFIVYPFYKFQSFIVLSLEQERSSSCEIYYKQETVWECPYKVRIQAEAKEGFHILIVKSDEADFILKLQLESCHTENK
jgi:hypothetical protein